MSETFLRIINMSISASWLVLAVLCLRFLMRKAPRWAMVLLWGIVGIRLICPFSMECVLSLIPSVETIPLNIGMDTTPAIHSGIDAINSTINPIIQGSNTPAPGDSVNPLQITIAVFANIWVLGALGMSLYTAITYLSLRRKLATAVRLLDNVFQSEIVHSPFVLGIIRPRIYLPYTMDEANRNHVIAHEQAHIRRRDHWWKPLGFGLLTVHWFNPLMWVAYCLLCRDIELACDEKVISQLGNEQRADYTLALLECSVNRRMIAACPLAFGEVGVKERVRNVMNYKKPGFWIMVVAVIVCIAVAVCFLTDPPARALNTLPEVYSQKFGVVDLLYDSPWYSFTLTPQVNSPEYLVTEQMELLTRGELSDREDWTNVGMLEEIRLTRENFDKRFLSEDGWLGESASYVRRNTARAWYVLYHQEYLYYLLQLKNGEWYLAYGYYDYAEKDDPGSDDTAFRWLCSLAPEPANPIDIEYYLTVGEEGVCQIIVNTNGQEEILF